MEAKIFKMNGTENGSIKLNEEVFASKAHPQTITDVVKAQLNNQRQGNAFTKSKGEVCASTRKIYRQKGTGRARQGSVKSPLHVGGGTTFGPRPHAFDQRPPKKVVDRAIIGVLTDKANEGAIRVVEGLDFTSGKTKDVCAFLKSHKIEKALFVVPEITENTRRAVANLKNVKVVTPLHVNVVDLLNYGQVAISDKAVKMLEEVLVK
ncbi:MAG: large subunit ribosomal protein [Clostridiales bacterium]|jgi:large subunit ribosomal protein L4|nr:large subunit ribosomal protein [Clostridiales bacterium]MDN5280957.1 large subunit ribosomal protein [Candidatus Ozemobacter sp.]